MVKRTSKVTEPKLPHERDESPAEASASDPNVLRSGEVIRRAHDDVRTGKQDTDRGPVMDRTYQRLRKK